MHIKSLSLLLLLASNSTLDAQVKKEVDNVFKLYTDSCINVYIDSLIEYSADTSISNFPYFIIDSTFDNQMLIWKGLHRPKSLRWEILMRIEDLNLLLVLNERLKYLKTASSNFQPIGFQNEMPFKQCNFNELIIIRLNLKLQE